MTTFLVTGASGHLGGQIVSNLLAANPDKVIAGSRDPAKLSALTAAGAEARKVDFDDPALSAAFAGVDRLLIVSTDSLDQPGRRLEQHKTAIAAAKAAGVAHVFYTSMPNPEPGSLVSFAFEHYGTEEALKASGLDYTILRNAWYAENLLMGLPHALATGQWFTATGDGRTAYAWRDDQAAAAAAALIKAPKNATLTLTGPEALTAAEIAAIVSEVTGKPLSVVPVTVAQLEDGIKAAGLPAFLAPVLASFDAEIARGGFAGVTSDIADLTGKTPRTVRAFVEANAAAFTVA